MAPASGRTDTFVAEPMQPMAGIPARIGVEEVISGITFTDTEAQEVWLHAFGPPA